METISVAEARRVESVGKEATLRGWVRTRRDSKGGFSFLELNDGSCLGNVQVVAEAALPNYQSEVLKLSAGCSVTVEGAGQRLAGQGAADRGAGQGDRRPRLGRPGDLPLAEEGPFAGVPARRWPTCGRAPTPSAPWPACAISVCRSIHQFFQEHGFLYIHTPIITASDCEGAGQMFQVTTLDPAKPPRDAAGVDYKQDFFGRPSYLTVSGQLEAEIFACALGKVYTFGPTFRAENSNTSRHLAEFWMVEPEMAFFELTDNMDLAEAFLKRIFRDVLERCAEDMQFFHERIDPTVKTTLEGIVDQRVRAPDVHRGGGDPVEIGAGVRVPDAMGRRPAGRARALSDRKALPRSR